MHISISCCVFYQNERMEFKNRISHGSSMHTQRRWRLMKQMNNSPIESIHFSFQFVFFFHSSFSLDCFKLKFLFRVCCVLLTVWGFFRIVLFVLFFLVGRIFQAHHSCWKKIELCFNFIIKLAEHQTKSSVCLMYEI